MSEQTQNHEQMLRMLPAVHELSAQPAVQQFARENDVSRQLLVLASRHVLANCRRQILAGRMKFPGEQQMLAQLERAVVDKVRKWILPRLRRVINGTGVILHTNLGRALLSESAIHQLLETSACYSNLEFDIEAGRRGSRHAHVEELICLLTGAEAALVVNNNAAAVYLILRELARDRQVIVSRGELVEIGGSFRVSEIMAESGAKLVEVGTTNKTHLRDYEQAINEETAMLMKVHASNFRTIGFTSSVSARELTILGKKFKLPVYEDLGSGMLFDFRPYGIGQDEPLVKEVMETGVDLVSFSGDKLLGGPQAGIIAGRKKWVDRLKKNQLARVLRVDKMTLAALDATLRQYLFPERAKREIPVIRDILLPVQHIEHRAKQFLSALGAVPGVSAEMADGDSEIGGGTMPGVTIPTKTVMIKHSKKSAHHLERKLRSGEPPVVVRLLKEHICIDFRTVMDGEIGLLAAAVRQALN